MTTWIPHIDVPVPKTGYMLRNRDSPVRTWVVTRVLPPMPPELVHFQVLLDVYDNGKMIREGAPWIWKSFPGSTLQVCVTTRLCPKEIKLWLSNNGSL